MPKRTLDTSDGVGSVKTESNGENIFTLSLTADFVTEPFDAQHPYQLVVRTVDAITGAGTLTLQFSEDLENWETELEADDTTTIVFTVDSSNDYWRVRNMFGNTTGWWRLKWEHSTVSAGSVVATLNVNNGA